jgi:flagellar basal body rod protein FlgG
MNYGLYLSATGVLTNLHRMDVLANNLANVNTAGFKPDAVITRQRLPARLEGPANADPQWMLERLGGGQLLEPTRTIHAQGRLIETGNELDVAIDGDGFLVVSGDASSGGGRTLLTRDGRLTINSAGELVQASTGRRVLEASGRPIQLATDQPASIRSSGEIEQGGEVVGAIRLVDVPDSRSLRKVGDNLYRPDDASARRLAPARGSLVQGAIEGSAVDPIITLNAMLSATRGAEANTKLMQYADNLMGQAINTLGRVA